MRWGRAFCGVVVALSLVLSLDSLLPPSPVDAKRKLVSRDSDLARLSSPIALRRNGELLIADRVLRCGRVRNVLDPGLPTPGSAPPGVVVLNPYLLNRQPDAVRLFVFHHECGHHHVGASELWKTAGLSTRAFGRAGSTTKPLSRYDSFGHASLWRWSLCQPPTVLCVCRSCQAEVRGHAPPQLVRAGGARPRSHQEGVGRRGPWHPHQGRPTDRQALHTKRTMS
jgi:hypothetical protein